MFVAAASRPTAHVWRAGSPGKPTGMKGREGLVTGVLFGLAAVLLLVPLAYLLSLALGGADLAETGPTLASPRRFERHEPLVWLFVATGGALLALAGWWREAVRARRLTGAEERAREELGERLRQEEAKLANERERRVGIETARAAERQWNRQLRAEVAKAHAERGVLGHVRDIRELVLRVAVELTESEKGLLLSRSDRDADGLLDLVVSEGFQHDPRDSAVAQRFGEEVLERDRIVREDDRARLDAEKRTPADEEIRNLVAIPIFIQDQFSGVVVCANHPDGFASTSEDVLLALGDHAGAVLDNSRLRGELRDAYLATVRLLAEAIDAKDPGLRGHSAAVSEYVTAVADRLGVEPRGREELVFGSLLHDVGKLGISERILLKPGALTPEERSVIQLHPRIGYHLLRQVPALEAIAPAVLHHHERFDGDGYPGGLRGEQIPLEARVVSVVDAFTAMTEQRPYREPVSTGDACQELERCAGSQFDPEVVRLFVEEVRRRPPEEVAGPRPERAELDPELEVRRESGEPRFGMRSFGVTDSLTLLYSHRYVHEAARSEAQRAQLQQRPFSVALAELTDLEEINRRDGYGAGDEAIQRAAQAAHEVAGRFEATACRYSGRRLGILAPGAEDAQREALVAELRTALSDGTAVAVGGATWRPDDTADAVIARARAALAAGSLPR